jgi:hypothetical protein
MKKSGLGFGGCIVLLVLGACAYAGPHGHRYAYPKTLVSRAFQAFNSGRGLSAPR